MSGMEDRLGDMLTRIATETQEIKELEQQLTDGEELTDQSEGLWRWIHTKLQAAH